VERVLVSLRQVALQARLHHLLHQSLGWTIALQVGRGTVIVAFVVGEIVAEVAAVAGPVVDVVVEVAGIACELVGCVGGAAAGFVAAGAVGWAVLVTEFRVVSLFVHLVVPCHGS